MKKFFTLIAATLMAVGANAQLISWSESVTAADLDAAASWGSGDFVVSIVDNAGKMKIDENSQYFGTAESYQHFTHRLNSGGKTGTNGGVLTNYIIASAPAAGTLKVYVRSGSASAADRALTIEQDNTQLYNSVVKENETTDYATTTIDDAETKIYPVIDVSVKAGDVLLKYNNGMYFYGIEFVAGDGNEQGGGDEEQGDGETTEGTVIASYDAGTMTGTWSTVGTSANDDNLTFSAKYNKNSTSVTTITLPSGATKDGAWQYAVKVEGEFKAGDVITIQPFTQMSTKDYTGAVDDTDPVEYNPTKYANILLYYEQEDATTSETSPKQIADLTGSAAGALTVTDGHEEEGTPKEFTYTLEDDYTNLFFARGGNTRINLMKVTITRPTETGINAVTTETSKTTAVKKYVEGNQIVIIKDGRKYNVAGAQIK